MCHCKHCIRDESLPSCLLSLPATYFSPDPIQELQVHTATYIISPISYSTPVSCSSQGLARLTFCTLSNRIYLDLGYCTSLLITARCVCFMEENRAKFINILIKFQRRQEELERRAQDLERREQELRNAPYNGKNSSNQLIFN